VKDDEGGKIRDRRKRKGVKRELKREGRGDCLGNMHMKFEVHSVNHFQAVCTNTSLSL